jgi:hypothetical protein
MALEIQPFSGGLLPALREFHDRLTAGGADPEMRFPPAAEMLPGSQLYLAVDSGVVRGGYILRPQQFLIRGELRPVAHYRLPLSEGLVDKRYAMLGASLLRSALKAQPLLYALGMGGFDRPLPRMLKATGWSLCGVPFFFRVVRPARFLRNIQPLRQSALRRVLMDLAAFTGAGAVGVRLWNAVRKRPAANVPAKVVPSFADWADEVWRSAGGGYPLCALRDSRSLTAMYPESSPQFLRLKVDASGWAVLLDTFMRKDKYFGNMRVGAIADCLAAPGNARPVVRAARRELERRRVDLIVTNQAHRAWQAALRDEGFLSGPTNFLFAASPQLAQLMAPFETAQNEFHINRGDGDGPIHL